MRSLHEGWCPGRAETRERGSVALGGCSSAFLLRLPPRAIQPGPPKAGHAQLFIEFLALEENEDLRFLKTAQTFTIFGA